MPLSSSIHPLCAHWVLLHTAFAQLLQVLLLDELTTFLDDEDQGGVLRAVRDVTSGDRRVTALWVSAMAGRWHNSSFSIVRVVQWPSVFQISASFYHQYFLLFFGLQWVQGGLSRPQRLCIKLRQMPASLPLGRQLVSWEFILLNSVHLSLCAALLPERQPCRAWPGLHQHHLPARGPLAVAAAMPLDAC